MLVCDQDWPKGRGEGGGHKTGNSINLLAHWRLKNDGVISALGLRCLIRSYFCCKRKQLTQDTGVETTVKKPLDSIENRDLEVVNNPNPSPGGAVRPLLSSECLCSIPVTEASLSVYAGSPDI